MKKLKVKKLELCEVKMEAPTLYALIDSGSMHGPAYTVYDEDTGKPVFFAGMQRIFEHMGEAWFQFVPGSESYIAVPRTAREILHKTIAEMDLERVQATADVRRPELPGWLKFMGFEYECTLRKYGHEGQDVDMYVMFPGEYPWE